MVLREGLVWAIVEGLFDLGAEDVASEVVGSRVGEFGLLCQMGISLGPQSKDRAPDGLDKTLYPAVSDFAGVLGLGADAISLCPFVGEAAVEGVGPTQRGLRGVGSLDSSEVLGSEFGLLVRVGGPGCWKSVSVGGVGLEAAQPMTKAVG